MIQTTAAEGAAEVSDGSSSAPKRLRADPGPLLDVEPTAPNIFCWMQRERDFEDSAAAPHCSSSIASLLLVAFVEK